MTTIPPAAPQPHDPANPPPVAGADEFRLKVESFWVKNRSFIFLCCLAVLALILGREGWQFYRASVERGVQDEYARVAGRLELLPKFAEANRGHALAGVAWLRLADEAYQKDDFRTAAAHYSRAAEELTAAALKSRARLGAAISQFSAGDRAAAETGLKALVDDAAGVATLRAEAAFHLATLAQEAGRTAEAAQLLEQISQIEPMGLWAQRAFVLRAQLATAAPAAPAAATDSAPAVQL